MPPHFSEGIRFTDGIAELPRYVDQLRNRERCDLVVLLSHLGVPQDLDLVSRVEGVDVCLSAHTHHRLEAPVVVNKTIVIQSGCHGSFLGVLRLGIKPSEISMLEHRLVPVTAEIEPDPQIEALVERALATQPDDSTTVVGTCPVPLSRAMMLESTADNVLLDAMRKPQEQNSRSSTDGVTARPIPAGPITVESDLQSRADESRDLHSAAIWRRTLGHARGEPGTDLLTGAVCTNGRVRKTLWWPQGVLQGRKS